MLATPLNIYSSYKFNNHIELQYHSIDDTILNDIVHDVSNIQSLSKLFNQE